MKRWATWLASTRRVWWIWPVVWLLLTVVVVKALPNLTRVASAESTSFLPASAEPSVAQHYLGRIKATGGGRTVEVVLHRQSGALTAQERRVFAARLARVHLGHVVGPAPARGASPFLAPNGRTDFAVVSVPGSLAVTAAVHRIDRVVGVVGPGTRVAVTGSSVIAQAVSQSDLSGLNRMLVVTLIVVVAIMLFVFRSPVAPLVSMGTIGTAFAITSGLVALWGQHGLPVSTYTQTFLIAIMFGAGTDYGILLMSRFREELQRSSDVGRAMTATMVAVGPTALVAAATLMLAFAAVGLAHFTLYRTAVGVAVGVLVIAVALLTVVPALLMGLGPRVFWPLKPVVGGEVAGGGTWARMADTVTRQPLWAVIPGVALAVLAFLGSGPLSFNEIQQLPQNQPSVQAFAWIEHGFGGGEVLPLNVVIHDPPTVPHGFRSVTGLEALDRVSRAVARQPGVKAVEGPLSPLGVPLTALEVSTQARSAASGVAKMNAALTQLAAGLRRGARQGAAFEAGLPRITRGLGQLQVSTELLASGLGKSQSAAVALNQGSLSLYQGLEQYQAALSTLEAAAGQLATGAGQVQQGSAAAAAGAAQLGQGASGLSGAAGQMALTAAQLTQGLAAASARQASLTRDAQSLAQEDPALSGNTTYQALQQGLAAEGAAIAGLESASAALQQGLTAASGQSQALSRALASLAQSVAAIDAGTATLAHGLGSLSGGLGQLAHQTSGLVSGAHALSGGLTELSGGTASLARGAAQIGQSLGTAAAGLSSGSGQAGQLVAGLTQASHGTQEVAVHLGQLGTLFLTPLASQAGTTPLITPGLLANPQFQPVLKAYVSPGGHVATLTVVLSQNPYDAKAMSQLGPIRTAIQNALRGTPFHGSQVYLGGSTSQSVALQRLSGQDFGQTALLVLVVIGVMLLILLRSLLAPVLLLGLVSLNYFATTRVAAWVATGWLHQSGLAWTVPFFSFLLLVALGVDYIIFYMARFREEESRGIRPALVRTARLAAPVVFSAALIMAGTFGSMAASGAVDLMEIGITVVIGLGLDMVLIMGITAPAAVRILGPVLHWPFSLRPPASAAADA